MSGNKAFDAWLSGDNHHLVTASAANWPALLAETGDAPERLFVRGDPNVLSLPQLAIVGSRNATPGGCETIRKESIGSASTVATRGMSDRNGLLLAAREQRHRRPLLTRLLAAAGLGFARLRLRSLRGAR